MDFHVIRYEFATGETVQVEIAGEIAEFIRESRRKEHANNERSRYHAAFSIDSDDYRRAQLISYKTPDDHVIDWERLFDSISQLSAVQKERILMLSEGKTTAEIAHLQSVAHNSVKSSIQAAQRKIKSFFLKTPSILPCFFC